MAASNWDTMAFDKDGSPGKGSILSPTGIKVSIYKNYVTVDKGDTHLASIDEGRLRIGDVRIEAVREEMQNSVFLFARYDVYKDGEPPLRRWMGGIGCYGFDDPTDRILAAAGLTLEEGQWAMTGSLFVPGREKSVEIQVFSIPSADPKLIKKVEIPYSKEYDSKWVGVTPELEEKYHDWIAKCEAVEQGFDDEPRAWARMCREKRGRRINQGDVMFGDADGTPAGQATDPIALRMIGEMS